MKHATQIETLGNRLDLAESAADLTTSWSDPAIAIENRWAEAYFYFARKPWMRDKRPRLLAMPSVASDGDLLPKLWHAVEVARGAHKSATTRREHIDVDVLVEKAEGIYDLVFWRWQARMNRQAIQRQFERARA